MWRPLALSLLLGCSGGSGATPADAAVMRTSKFTPLLCTSGTPGDATCPINTVDLGLTPQLEIQFVAEPIAQSLNISHIRLTGAATHVDGMYLELWAPDNAMPAASVLVTASYDVASGAAIDPVTLTTFSATETLSIRLDAIR